MLAGALGICGLDIGTNFRPEPHPCNPKGYFEDLDFKRINRKLMRAAGIGPGSFIFPDKWTILPDSVKRRDEMIDLIQRWRRGHPVGWKDPRACLTLGIWKKYIPDLKVITISRPTIEIANSLHTRRSDYPIEHGLAVTKIYLEQLEYHCKGIDRLDVQYHDFFGDKETRELIFFHLCVFVGVDPVKGWLNKIDGFIDKKLWRERQSVK
jgi:hypothetical protein